MVSRERPALSWCARRSLEPSTCGDSAGVPAVAVVSAWRQKEREIAQCVTARQDTSYYSAYTPSAGWIACPVLWVPDATTWAARLAATQPCYVSRIGPPAAFLHLTHTRLPACCHAPADSRHGQADPHFFTRREFCFTLDGDIFVRYQAFKVRGKYWYLKSLSDRSYMQITIGQELYAIRPPHRTGVLPWPRHWAWQRGKRARHPAVKRVAGTRWRWNVGVKQDPGAPCGEDWKRKLVLELGGCAWCAWLIVGWLLGHSGCGVGALLRLKEVERVRPVHH